MTSPSHGMWLGEVMHKYVYEMIDRMPSKLRKLEKKYLSKQNTYLSWDGLRTTMYFMTA